MSLTGPPKPTFLYTRFKYARPLTPTTVITLDMPEPSSVLAQAAPSVGLANENRVASGKAEILFSRLEESCALVLRCEADMLQALRWMCEDSVFRGTQCQVWIDRYTGSCWMFEDTLKDQNGLALTLQGGGTDTYGAATTGRGIVLAGAQYLTGALAQSSAPTPTGYDDPMSKDEGVLVIDFLPAYASTDSVERYIVSGKSTGADSWAVVKNSANQLVFTITDTTNTPKSVFFNTAPAWSAGDRVQIVTTWTTAGAMTLQAAVSSGAFTTATSTSGAGTGIVTVLPSALSIGARITGASLGPGTFDTVAFFKRAFTSPLSLVSFRPWRRNYFPYGEVLQRQFQPSRVSFGRPIYDWPIAFRNGKP